MKASIRTGVALALAAASTVALAGETTYTGTGTYFATRVLMPLGNGGAAVTMNNTIVATISPADYGFLFGECSGLGYVSPDGEFSSTAYCNLREDDANSIDLHAENDGKGGEGKIIGGSGKWKGATGTVTFKRKFNEGDRGSFEYTFKVTTP